MGMNSINLKELEYSISTAQICINTIPYPTIDNKVLSAMNQSCLVIDLASGEGGTDFQAAELLGIKALHSLGLPGKTAPKTAGTILGDIFLEMLDKN